MPRTKRQPLAERFWPKVDKRGPDECWPWKAYAVNGYGRIGSGGHYGQALVAPRVAYELAHGPIADGLLVCHRCDNPACVNPAHLFLGTQKDNMQDCKAKGRARGPRHLVGEANGNSRLTAEQVRAIRASNLPRREVVERYGISRAQYWNIKNNQQWRSVQ